MTDFREAVHSALRRPEVQAALAELDEHDRYAIEQAITGAVDTPGSAEATATAITVGPLIAAMLAAVAAAIVELGLVEAQGNENEASAKEREAGAKDAAINTNESARRTPSPPTHGVPISRVRRP